MIKKILSLMLLSLTFLSMAAERIVSLSPAVTDMICDIGAADMLCGISSACNAPQARGKTVAGEMGKPNVKIVLKLHPDLLITDTRYPGTHWNQLEKFKIPVLFLPSEKIDDFPAALRLLGRRLGVSAAAERAAAEFESRISLLRRTKTPRPLRVLIIFNVNPLVSCGKNCFVSESITLAGARSVTENSAKSYFTLPSEFVLRSDPAVIISAGVPENIVKTFFARNEFRNVSAVRSKRIIFIDADKFCRAGMKLPDAVTELRTKLRQMTETQL